MRTDAIRGKGITGNTVNSDADMPTLIHSGRVFVGIDPGKKGAVVALDAYSRLLGCWDQPLVVTGKTKSGKGDKTTYDEQSMGLIIRECLDLSASVRGDGGLTDTHRIRGVSVTIEDVHSMPEEGAVGAFTFGLGCGLWRGIVIGSGCMAYQLVSPQAWTRAMLLGSIGTDAKARSVLVASRLWPSLDLKYKKDHDRAQAALIAEYGRRMWSGVLAADVGGCVGGAFMV